MKHGRKEERDTALWLNDEQVSLLEEHKERIKRQGEQQREHKRLCEGQRKRRKREKRRKTGFLKLSKPVPKETPAPKRSVSGGKNSKGQSKRGGGKNSKG